MTPKSVLSELSTSLVGHKVTRVFLDEWACGLITDNDAFVRLDSLWTLYDEAGKSLDAALPIGQRQGFELWRVCASEVLKVSIVEDPEPELVMNFSNGLVLRATGANAQWELVTKEATIVSEGKISVFVRSE